MGLELRQSIDKLILEILASQVSTFIIHWHKINEVTDISCIVRGQEC